MVLTPPAGAPLPLVLPSVVSFLVSSSPAACAATTKPPVTLLDLQSSPVRTLADERKTMSAHCFPPHGQPLLCSLQDCPPPTTTTTTKKGEKKEQRKKKLTL